jgi:hypothetical protein
MFIKRFHLSVLLTVLLLQGCVDYYDNPRYHWTNQLKPGEVIPKMRELPLEERYEMYLYVVTHTHPTRHVEYGIASMGVDAIHFLHNKLLTTQDGSLEKLHILFIFSTMAKMGCYNIKADKPLYQAIETEILKVPPEWRKYENLFDFTFKKNESTFEYYQCEPTRNPQLTINNYGTNPIIQPTLAIFPPIQTT